VAPTELYAINHQLPPATALVLFVTFVISLVKTYSSTVRLSLHEDQ